MPSYNANNRIVMRKETTITGTTNRKCKYKLMIWGVGSYASDNIIHLGWIILCHRLHHFVNGEGFRD
jgi:hypothetical protein